ncbi:MULTISPECIES: MFS transporter [unclassified Novosphingobium]|uniref:MFS transporter n=1 Tax=unclassified Novosphingobium TaxID=2644732 RepID=UPI00146A2772|nr:MULTISPECIES: MFS transporter [unclassified Novosphingobium]NMN05313.1 MFS family permease [Novosphingobium sp. SG919]NMN87608.1 MFS family permease [Novosphingobium sp. SG916]
MATPINASAGSGPAQWTRTGLAIVALCFAINMADGIDVTILSFIAPRLQADWAIGADTMGLLFGAGLVGMAIGGMGIAPLADRLGRRRIILAALGLMSAGMVASGFAGSVPVLYALRVVVGMGIGTVLAAMAALAAEAAPAAQRNLAVGIVQAGYPFAAVFTALLTAHLLPIWGWHRLLLAAGGLTVVLFPAAMAILPRQHEGMPGSGAEPAGRIGDLLSPAFRARTLALWAAVFCGLMVLYFIVSWITKLSIQAGLSETDGIYAGALYNFGAFVGTAGMSVLAVRVPLGRLVPAMLVGAGVAMLVFGSVAMPVAATLALAFAIGVLLQGGYNGVWPLAAGVYPARMRATGVGWAIGLGRAGAVIGPMMGGWLMAAKAPLPVLFAAYCVPLLACAAAAFAVDRMSLDVSE